jgi:outer membrane biogenesis lipoprotein LolB
MKCIIFWDMMPCSLLSCNRRFGGTYRLHLQGRRNHFSKNQQVSRWQAEYSARQKTIYIYIVTRLVIADGVLD